MKHLVSVLAVMLVAFSQNVWAAEPTVNVNKIGQAVEQTFQQKMINAANHYELFDDMFNSFVGNDSAFPGKTALQSEFVKYHHGATIRNFDLVGQKHFTSPELPGDSYYTYFVQVREPLADQKGKIKTTYYLVVLHKRESWDADWREFSKLIPLNQTRIEEDTPEQLIIDQLTVNALSRTYNFDMNLGLNALQEIAMEFNLLDIEDIQLVGAQPDNTNKSAQPVVLQIKTKDGKTVEKEYTYFPSEYVYHHPWYLQTPLLLSEQSDFLD